MQKKLVIIQKVVRKQIVQSGNKWVYFFGEGDVKNKELLGGKGANLGDMTKIGLPVPAGFTITTEACAHYYKNNKNWPAGLQEQINENIKKLEASMGMKFGDKKNPLLVSVRSGAKVSMPGMMDTILNLGLNDETVKGMIEATQNERFALDCYRRFIQMFSDVVMEVEHRLFEEALENKRKTRGVNFDNELTPSDLKELIEEYKTIVKKAGKSFPQDVNEQLKMAVNAVFSSWNSARAIKYREINEIKNLAGTAVNVQAMVFGNMGSDSGTGVAFTRNPSTGENKFYGEYLINAQGEDVVAGIRTPEPISRLEKDMPAVYRQLMQIREKLENHYKDMQDIEFTVQKGKLYMLQTRNGKRTGLAAVKIAVDMVSEKLISQDEALLRVDANQLNQLLHKRIDPIAKSKTKAIAQGLPASPGAAVGKIVFNAEDAACWTKDKGEKVILVRLETSPEDIEGMHVSQGILTARGGMTCVGGDSLLLTDSGFYKAEELFNLIENGLKPKILSFDSASMKTKWKNIIAAGRKQSEVLKIDISQSGRTEGNSLMITPEHKMMIINNRKLEKIPLNSVLENQQFVSIIDKIPSLEKFNDSDYAYLAGAIFTDGNLMLNKRRGRVTFTQKSVPEKMDFINRVKDIFFSKFGQHMKERQRKPMSSNLDGRIIVSSGCFDYICSQKAPVQTLLNTKQGLVQWVLNLDEQATYNFLAGLLDGDGSYGNGRLHLYIGKPGLLPAVVVSCLKLGIVPQVTPNRQHYNVQIVEKIEEICRFTSRIKPDFMSKKYESKLFSVKQLFGNVSEHVDFTGIIKPAIKENKMLGACKIKERVLDFSKLNPELKKEIEFVINSDLRMYRIKSENSGLTDVYNFEVDSVNELDKNFVVFTKRFTPLLVSNSHAAVVARGMGKCCVAGCSDLMIDENKKALKIGNNLFKEGDFLTLDGTTGEVYPGKVPVIDPELAGEFAVLMDWAKKKKKLGIRTNADTPKDAEVAKNFGAEGIGLTRTEHMFFEGERITAMREMILADNEEGRRRALAKLLPYQRADFEGIFRVMNNLPVIIRFLDPPLHEFLPKEADEVKALAKILGISEEKIKNRIDSLHEFNPMLGFRGCRLGIVYPEISEMQARAVFEAAINAAKQNIVAIPEIEIPNVITLREFKLIKDIIQRVAKETGAEGKIHYKVGTMIEFPRAALTADELAKEAEFMSFGTNDLTQTTLGFSRDDAGKFIPCYVQKGVFEKDPFQTIDQEGVGKIMKIAVTKARSVKKDMDIGICGEHGGDPASVKFCHKIGLSNVSCSPYRIPIAILAAAQATIEGRVNTVQNKIVQNKPQQKVVQQSKPVQQQRPQQNQKQHQKSNFQVKQKPLPKARTIRDEIRDIIREELRNLRK